MSLRRRVLLGCVLVAVVLLVADTMVMSTFRGYLTSRVDQQLTHAASGFVDPLGSQLPPALDSRHLDTAQTPPESGHVSEFYLGFADPGSGALTRVYLPLRDDLTPPSLDQEDVRSHVTAEGEPIRPFTLAGPDRWRMVAVASSAAATTVVVGASLEETESIYRRMLTVLTTATAAVLSTLAVMAWWLLRHGVRPLAVMTTTAEAIAEGALHERVSSVDERTEAGRLGAALNRMLAHIQEAFAQRGASEERLRCFVADASHELRTPVTSIRGYAELHRAGALEDPAALADAMRRIEQEGERMGILVDDLLLLARFDQARPMRRQPVDLAGIATDVVADLHAVQPDRPVTVDAQETTVQGDDAHLRQAVGNLLANARIHTPPGTSVHVRVHRENGWAVVEVADDGPGMPPVVAERVFERFYRADPARTRVPYGDPTAAGRPGSGLGLAIVASIIGAHGGDVAVESAPGRGACFRLRLPLGTDHTDGPARR